jgi:hypothetical protein
MGVSSRTVTSGELIDGVTLLNGTVNVNGTVDGIKLDADGDTTIASSNDDQIDIKVAGAVDFSFTLNTLSVLTNSKIQGQGSCIFASFPAGRQTTLSGAGAVTITEFLTKWTTTGANAATLADGATVGQLKKVLMVVDAGDGTLTPTNLDTYTSITFEDVGDFVILMWDGVNWVVAESGNTVDGLTGPVLA